MVTLRLMGVACWVGLLAFLLNPRWMAWSALPLPVWSRWAGVVIGAITILLLTWTFRSLGKNSPIRS